MSAQDSPLAPAPLPPRRKTSLTLAVGLPFAAVAAGGVAVAWAAARATTDDDRLLVTSAAGAATLLLGIAVALAMARHRMSRELRHRTEWLRAEAARGVAAHEETARRATAELETAQRAAREAEVRRRTCAEAEVSLRAALKTETARSAALEGETARLAEVTIPLAVDRLRSGGSAETVLSRLPQPTGPAHQRLLDVLVREIGAGERLRAAGMAACASAAGRVQALTTAMLADLREMEHRHGEDVLGDLLHLDHCTAQTGRLADSIAVLSGARSGRRWTKPIVMESVLRGAMGRINAYQRVRLHSASTAAVAGFAAEGVMHALAELMDNACNFSPPTEEVHVYVQETHSGIVVTIEDAGLVMPDATLARAEKLVSGDPLDVRVLSGTRLGLAVVGCLARKYGLLVSFRPSSRGGTGVVVLIPAKIVTQAPEGYPVAAAAPAGTAGPAGQRPAAGYPAEYGRDPGADFATGYGAGQGTGQGAGRGTGHGPGRGTGYDAGYDTDFGAGFGTGFGGPDRGVDERHDGVPPGASYEQTGAAARQFAPLPKRPRGQTLAASQHGDLSADPTAAWLDPSPEEEARAARARAAAGSRFSAFRDAATGRSAADAQRAEQQHGEQREAPGEQQREPYAPDGGGHMAERAPERRRERGGERTGDRTGERAGEARRPADFTSSGEGPLPGEAWDH